MPKEIKGEAMITECLMPLEQSIDTDRSLFSILEERAGRTPDRSLIEYKDPDTGSGGHSPPSNSETRSSRSRKDSSPAASCRATRYP